MISEELARVIETIDRRRIRKMIEEAFPDKEERMNWLRRMITLPKSSNSLTDVLRHDKHLISAWLAGRALVLPASQKVALSNKFGIEISVVNAVEQEIQTYALGLLEDLAK